MSTPEQVSPHAAATAQTTTATEVNEALRRFMASPSLSNKIAAITAMQALFAEMDRAEIAGRGGS